MKTWIDRDLCTGNGICEEIAPEVFVLVDSLAFARDAAGNLVEGNGATSAVAFADSSQDAVIEAAEECPGECIYLEP